MLQPRELPLEEMGDLADIIPGQEPVLQAAVNPIPQFGATPRRPIIPVCEPTLSGNELKYITDAVETNWISSAGSYIRRFESLFAEKMGTRYGVACANGTVALHLALATLGMEPGDEVIIPTFTMIATANSVTYLGAKPVLVDAEPCTWNMDVEQIESKITPRTRAIVLVHTYGHPVDMDALNAIASKHGLFVLEDAAEAHGARYKDRPVGSLGDAASFSFYGNKIITTGEGGMVTTNREDVAKLAWNLRDHAFSHERHFWHKYLGYNYRMTNLQAAIGLAQTEQLEHFVDARRANAAYYTQLLSEIPGIVTPPEAIVGHECLLDVRHPAGRGVRADARRSCGKVWRGAASRRAPSSSRCTASRSTSTSIAASAIRCPRTCAGAACICPRRRTSRARTSRRWSGRSRNVAPKRNL